MTHTGGTSSSSSLPPGMMGTLQSKRSHIQIDRGSEYVSGGWIWVKNSTTCNDRYISRDDSNVNVEKFRNEYMKIEREGKMNITHETMITLAKKHNILNGKWLLYVKPERVGLDWPKIREAVLSGNLGSTAKMSVTPENGHHVVCIYCCNFEDKAELLRVRRAIMNDLQIGTHAKMPLRFKTDAFTHLGIYSYAGKYQNLPNMRTTTYDCGGDEDLSCTTLLLGSARCAKSEHCMKCYPQCLGLRKEIVLSIVGLNFAKAHAKCGEKVKLVVDPKNEDDSNAIRVMNIADECIGYIRKEQTKKLALRLDTPNFASEGTILDAGDGYAQLLQVSLM
mmetsp:Transcript_32442/g.68553  ORF Transcript_32442/g.68553 Transcript_32442/m.68553 type:complete len:335 (-) Transcript_32442:262-1266(-)